jgi:hypothetical protein
MQVERSGTQPTLSLTVGEVEVPDSGGRVSNAWATNPVQWDNTGKPVLIPHDT